MDRMVPHSYDDRRHRWTYLGLRMSWDSINAWLGLLYIRFTTHPERRSLSSAKSYGTTQEGTTQEANTQDSLLMSSNPAANSPKNAIRLLDSSNACGYSRGFHSLLVDFLIERDIPF